MIAHLFIVSRHEPQLFDYLRQEFAAEDDVHVILDRRIGGERRKHAGPCDVERRRHDRRAPSHVSRQINTLGYAFVRVGG